MKVQHGSRYKVQEKTGGGRLRAACANTVLVLHLTTFLAISFSEQTRSFGAGRAHRAGRTSSFLTRWDQRQDKRKEKKTRKA